MHIFCKKYTYIISQCCNNLHVRECVLTRVAGASFDNGRCDGRQSPLEKPSKQSINQVIIQYSRIISITQLHNQSI